MAAIVSDIAGGKCFNVTSHFEMCMVNLNFLGQNASNAPGKWQSKVSFGDGKSGVWNILESLI